MALIQALYLHDIDAAKIAMQRGQHPLHHIEHAVQLRHRPDVLKFLLSLVGEEDREYVVAVRDNLEFLDRYPTALDELNRWLSVHFVIAKSIQLASPPVV